MKQSTYALLVFSGLLFFAILVGYRSLATQRGEWEASLKRKKHRPVVSPRPMNFEGEPDEISSRDDGRS